MQRFCAMLDCSRNAVMQVSEIKRFATILKKFGYNSLMLYTEDTYEVDNEPFFGYMRGRYSKQELKEIVSYCAEIGMEVIPCIQTLAHLNQIFRWADYSQINDTADILLVGNKRTYELIENMFRSLRECFSSDYIHIGMDESHMVGLGKYLDENGFVNRFEILTEHLKRVIGLAEKYGFKPLMWSDMFFRLANHGEYYPKNPVIPNDVVNLTPKQIGLVYWDYYHEEKGIYDEMFSAHKKFGNDIWFAGGAWTWSGFAPGNKKTIDTMKPAMQSARDNGIENIIITMWGDDGKECSYYSVLPSLFAVKKYYEGETDIESIKKRFESVTGEDFDVLCSLDLPNYVAGNKTCCNNICKYMLYSDPFNGFLDISVNEKASEEFKAHADKLEQNSDKSEFSYIFDAESALCRFMTVKYALGKRTRDAYKAKDKDGIAKLIKDYEKAEELLEEFYVAFKRMWFKENKPHGFDVQDIRIGGLSQRLRACRERLKEYRAGLIMEIPELDEKVEALDPLYFDRWLKIATVNVISHNAF